MTSAGQSRLEPAPAADSSTRNWMGLTATITGALGLSVVAIALGHAALSAVKNGVANNRSFALAGTILGYIGLAVTGALAAWYFLVLVPSYERDLNDVHAQIDAAAVGREVALYLTTSGKMPTVVQTPDGYIVENVTLPAALTVERTLTFVGTSTNWCLLLAFEGGGVEAFSYLSATGLEPGDGCKVPERSAESSPSASPSPDPSA